MKVVFPVAYPKGHPLPSQYCQCCLTEASSQGKQPPSWHHLSQLGVCYNLNAPWNDAVTSLGPDAGITCTIYIDANCSGRSVGGIISPGIWNLSDYGFNDVASSLRCF
ncbi:hypothetical protein B0H63DRAFT_450374 [Podospora didyma]|uniref:Uncharacterized protein n=1 Tax=Podospora didyma TaxID=330526 RepID=A0AAE0NGG5_9PEZI|nr:hypothetical protein B0H63DRAFT_450374 [Podospora didyma]